MDVDSPQANGMKRKGRKSNENKASYREDSESEDMPLSKRRRTSSKPVKPESDSESDVPLAKKPSAKDVNSLSKQKEKFEKRAEKEAKAIRKDAPKKVKQETPKGNTKKQTPSASAKAKKAVVKDEEVDEDEDEEYRWWENVQQGDGTKKWATLEHNGVVFPPDYEPLPKDVKFYYDGNPIDLHPEAEEVATFYGSMLHSTVNVENPTFNKNFFEDFQGYIKKTGGAKNAKTGDKVDIKSFEKCNFKHIFEWFDAEREKKKALPAADKKAAKAEKDKTEAPYQYCMWDGRKQKVGNFRVEPPALFRGRGEHPKTGRVKKRVFPEQITINIGKDATVPAPPEGHKWKEVKHDQEGTWLAMWQENINGAYKYVMLAANSDVKGQSDYKKFEKARELKKHIDHIRKDYQKNLRAEKMVDRQMASAIYLIDRLALRAGNEKGEDEAETVGCCSLKYENITLEPPNHVIFDFLGKDSIRFYDKVEVDPQVFKNLKIFKKAPKGRGDDVFDRLTTSGLNKHLQQYMTGLTAKVFRTYNASWTMANLLKDIKATGNVAEKVKIFNDANRRVAILCNHKRTVAASHENTMEKMTERINGLVYQQWRCKQMMLELDSKIKKKKGAEYFALPSQLDEEWVRKHQADLVAEQREKIQKKFDKDNEKRIAEGEKKMSGKELDERLEAVDELQKKFKKENKTKKVEPEGRGPSVEKLEQNIDKITQRIETMKVQSEDKEANKEVALGTSKINYIDPRLSVVFSKKFDVPIERLFSKTLREKFDWAIKSVDDDWEF
ncbi:hypothetical protein FH972_025788 [Carpinus fangiana]|uniref:DNA topoisomerase I n=1 Tax=Carpinus fangiana TaxID=176857 RepID=A0A5N6L212_9ROSI|nr:hypothetical protein FH972_025788 [Carpinus fangiana]